MFQNDNEVYTKKPHCKPPKTDTVKVFCSFGKNNEHYRMVTSCSFSCEVEQKPRDIRSLCNHVDQGSVDLIALSPRFALAALEKKCLVTHRGILNDFGNAFANIVSLVLPAIH